MGADRVERTVEIHACGAGTDEPGPGGWCAVLRYGRHERELSGGEGTTTAKRMALTAVVRSLEALKWACAVRVHTDSAYVRDPPQPSSVENVDLWRRLGAELERHRVRWTAGNADTERAADLAAEAMREATAAADTDDECEHLLPISWCSWCKPPRAGILPRGFRTAGGRAYHNDPNCEWLLRGQRYAHRRGDTVHEIVPVAWGSADPGHYQPCEHCCTPAWVRRHRR